MTRTEALPLARNIAAAVCELDGCSPDFCAFMRDGSYDDHREVQAAQAALILGDRNRKPVLRSVDEQAA